MIWQQWLLWGFVATVVLTVILSASQGFGLTRMNLPYLLGTVFVEDRDRAKAVGILVHLANGWIFSLIYVAAFHVIGRATWWIGALGGLIQAAFVLTAGMTALPGIHPRMASAQEGPAAGHQIEPPGLFALHYGARTPISVVVAHLIFGAILGAGYVVG